MSMFHITYNQGRTDNVTLEANSHLNILEFFNQVSTAGVTIIKEILFSKNYNINYIEHNRYDEPFDRELRVMVETKKHKNKIITLRFAKKDLTKQQITKLVKQYAQVDDEPIIRVLDIVRWK